MEAMRSISGVLFLFSFTTMISYCTGGRIAMLYTEQNVFEYIEQEDVKFIRLTFCDITGRQKNISIMPYELGRAFSQGIQ